jgi:quercetin dioxygenase-like cupin family protein
MQTVDINALKTFEAWYENDPEVRVRAEFPFTAATGNATTSMVYFEIEPGHRLGTHTDSAEEIVVVLQGTVEATLGDERGQLSAGGAVLIPAMVPHGVRNIGNETARCIGFFSAAGVESVFDQLVMPFGTKVVSTIVESAV